MDLGSLMASATRSVSLTGPLAPKPEWNLALITADYLNLNLKLGYHYNIVDCFMTENRNDNFIYFRFAGGVTELARRNRRAELLRRILELHDFIVESREDLVIGRIKKISFDNMLSRLKMIGRLIGFTRQLDVHLRDDSMVDRCVIRFMEGRYQSRDA
jgi:pyruvate,water dikinase